MRWPAHANDADVQFVEHKKPSAEDADDAHVRCIHFWASHAEDAHECSSDCKALGDTRTLR